MIKKIIKLSTVLSLSMLLVACSTASKGTNTADSNTTASNTTDSNTTTESESGATPEVTAEDEATSTSSPIQLVADSDSYYGTTFGTGETIDVNVTISEEDWKDLLENATKEEYHTASITVNGTTVNNVGFRTKGFSSLTSIANSDSNRYGYKVKFDEYVDNQSLNGLDTLVLNGSFSDASYMRELLTYAASAYLNGLTPYVSYCRLSINGELQGLYLCVEAYDDSFVKRHTDSADAVLYKAVSENCTLLTSDDGTGFDVDYGDDKDYTHIKDLITVLNSTTEENKAQLEAVLDVDSVLKAIAVNTVMGNYDSYSGSKAHNYYLLYSNGKFSYIGWDYNMSLGGFSEDNGASVTVDVTEPVYNVDISKRPLIQKLLAIDEYNERYLGYINQLTGYFSNFEGMVAQIAEQISTDVENDPTAFYTYDQFQSCITASDTDLTQVQNTRGPGGMNPGNFKRPDQSSSNNENGGYPDSPNSNTENGGYPSFPDGNKGDAPQVPDGSDKPDFAYGEAPVFPDASYGPDFAYGEAPMQGGDNRMPNGFGGMLNADNVSIIDYLTQRIEQINSQLTGK